MPQLTLEYTSNCREKKFLSPLFAQLHDILTQTVSAALNSSKSRAFQLDTFYVGDGHLKGAFVHLYILLEEGRTLAQKQELGKRALQLLTDFYALSLQELDLQITVHVDEFEKNCYFKKTKNK